MSAARIVVRAISRADDDGRAQARHADSSRPVNANTIEEH